MSTLCSSKADIDFWCLFCGAVFQAQRLTSVTGYLRHDAFLPCKFIPGSKNDTVTQVQWGFKETEQNGTVILVSHYQLGVNVHDTFLKDKVEIREQSLIIRDLAARDAGLYTCTISAFPSGSFAASIRLVVRGKRHLQTSQLSRKSRRARVTCHVSPSRADAVIIGRGGRCCDRCRVTVGARCSCVRHVDQEVCVCVWLIWTFLITHAIFLHRRLCFSLSSGLIRQ